MWNVTAILLFILVFISPYFITTWRQFLQQVMSKLHWFAEKRQNILYNQIFAFFLFSKKHDWIFDVNDGVESETLF